MDPSVWPVVMDYSNRLDPDPAHARQVCRLSLILYSELEVLHALPAYARDLLKAAALLHDIGWSVPGKPHHKASRDIILKDTKMNLSSVERKIIAMIERYHRRSTPRSDHAVYNELDDLAKTLVLWCSGILRVADALDRAHQELVICISCTITHEEILLSCNCKSPIHHDLLQFKEKSRLLSEFTRRRITPFFLPC